MIEFFHDKEAFKQRVIGLKIGFDIDGVLKLDFPFFDKQKNFAVLSVPRYNGAEDHETVLFTKKKILMYSQLKFSNNKDSKEISKKKFGESTMIIFLMLKNTLKNYALEFERIRDAMNQLDFDPVLDDIEKSGRELRKLTDRCEELVKLIMTLKERDIKEFDTSLISFDYELLNTESRYWLERCRSHIYRVASLRTKSEMRSNKELNNTMSRLTVIMTFLTITSIVVSVPGTIGAIFGIPALSDAYFKPHTTLLVLILIVSTLLSIVLGYVYWKSLGLGRGRRNIF